jgi:Rrf2 family protein
MNFSKTTEYALRILAFMAKEESTLYSANDIYENLNIPFRYLRKLLTLLSKSGLLISIQGKHGGYKISKNPNEISLLTIINISGDSPVSNECFFGFQNCAVDDKCAMHDKWTAVRENMIDVLNSTSLAELNGTEPNGFFTNK